MILPDQVNLAQVAYFQHQLEEELEYQARIVKARALDAGYYDDDLATQTLKYLVAGQANEIEGINLMAIALRTIIRRVDIQSISATDEEFEKYLLSVYSQIGLDSMQAEIHKGAERDGEYFVIIDYDLNTKRDWAEGEVLGLPSIFLHERYTSAEATFGTDEAGSNEGCKAHYRNGDPNQQLDMVSKRWIETRWENEEPVTQARMTLYIAKQNETPARIEKYVQDGDEWSQHQDEYVDETGTVQTEEWPIWWTEDRTETGRSLPIPVVHFRNEEITPITKRLWGMQSGMDHAWSSMLGAITLVAHQIFTAFGFYPTTDGKPPADDGSNALTIQPRTIIGNADVKPGDASFDAIDPGDLRPLIDAMDKVAIYTSFVAGLPINNFVISKSVASSSTLRQGESDLVAHVNALFRLFGRSWSQVFEIMRELENLFGVDEYNPSKTEVLWADAETVNIEAVTAEATAQYNTGIPWQVIARTKWGYSDEQITEMQKILDTAAAAATEPSAETEPDNAEPDDTTNQDVVE